METIRTILVEASSVDCIWGIGYNARDLNALIQKNRKEKIG